MFILRNYTIENLFPEEVQFSGYDEINNIPEDESLIVWCYQVPINTDTLNLVDWVNDLKEKLALVVDSLIDGQRLIMCSLIDLFHVQFEAMNVALEEAIHSFNAWAINLANENSFISFVDVQKYFAKYPCEEWINWRFYYVSQMIVAPQVASGFYHWFRKELDFIDNKRKKCLVFDLDNTIWGGILGEDGPEGIKMDGDYPGNAFADFQNALINLSKAGIILAACSKNNEEDVVEVWENHPFLKLKREFISAYRINWQNKADNIREISEELNIGLDSIVFIDDNPTERELVRNELPMVAVPEFPSRPYNLMKFFKELVDDYFCAYKLTSEDASKTAQYAANKMRATEMRRFANLDEFIKSLKIEITLEPLDEFNIGRLSQLANKTNQFNLTTQRYTEADLQHFKNQGDIVLGMSISDRFGDYGLTGLTIVRTNDNIAEIDTFLLSCRVLGKGIENEIFKAIVNILHAQGVTEIRTKYIPTAKNKIVADFYSNNGMIIDGTTAKETSYHLNIVGPLSYSDSYKVKII